MIVCWPLLNLPAFRDVDNPVDKTINLKTKNKIYGCAVLRMQSKILQRSKSYAEPLDARSDL
jgi:hypothetical protein